MGGSTIINPITSDLGSDGVTFFQNFVPKLITLALIIGVVIFFFTLVMGAIKWITSGGDKQAVEAARGKITSALVGLIILFASFAVLELLEHFFNIDLLALDISKLFIR